MATHRSKSFVGVKTDDQRRRLAPGWCRVRRRHARSGHISLPALALGLGCLFGTAARAAECDANGPIRSGVPLSAASVTGTGRLALSRPAGQTTYLAPGDEVMVLTSRDDKTCVAFTAPTATATTTTGWVDGENLQEVSDGPPPEDWTGLWRSDRGRVIRIAATPTGWLSVEASAARWGARPLLLANGRDTSPTLSGDIAPAGGMADLDNVQDAACGLHFTRVGSYLLAAENDTCASQSTVFTGPYRRAER